MIWSISSDSSPLGLAIGLAMDLADIFEWLSGFLFEACKKVQKDSYALQWEGR